MENLLIVFWLMLFCFVGALISLVFMKIFKKEILQFIPLIVIGLIVGYYSFKILFLENEGMLELAYFLSILFGSAFIGSITASIIYKKKQGK